MIDRLSRLTPLFVAAYVAFAVQVQATTSILFDATKAESAGNADWVVDADVNNLAPNSAGTMVASSSGHESNPQFIPTGPQNAITATTAETYWKGALSSWGVDAAQRGYTIRTLSNGNTITYGTAAATDLKNFKVFVIDEPNISFTAAEKTALIAFVSNGGGLMMLADHNSSDRNGDVVDAPVIWNDFFTNNGAAANPFGISFNNNNVSVLSTAVDTSAADPLTRGKAGSVANFEFNAGSTITIDPTKNASVRAGVWQSATHTNANVMAAYATYGSGRVVAVGDSSPADDGTGDTGDTLFDGWHSGTNAALFENATLWLSGSTTAVAPPDVVPEPTTLTAVVFGAAMTCGGRRRRGRPLAPIVGGD